MTAGLAESIVAALDRLAHARRAQRQSLAGEAGLTLLQLDLLETLAAGVPPAPLVGALAAEIGVSQPTVTDSVRALERKGLLTRDADPADARRGLLVLTAAGRRLAEDVARRDLAFRDAVAALPASAQEQAYGALLATIAALVDAGTITVARTCTTCLFHRHDGATHRCTLLGTDLPVPQLRVDCRDHQRA
ncbi:MAG: MarR family winged helix-turn-helix transcriptional regulator [Sporichthyaceae bacterium]